MAVAEDTEFDLTAELDADQGRSPTGCSWRQWLDSLPPDSASQWRQAVEGKAHTIASIMRALRRREVDIGRSTVERHRSGSCKSCRS